MYSETEIETEKEAGPAHSSEKKEKTLADIRRKIKEDRKHIAAWRVNARHNYDFFAGKQWDDSDTKILEEQNRPPVTFNRVARVINAVSGLELQNRQEVRYLPREMNDVGVNELLTNAAKWVRDNCDAEDEESECFNDSLICGMGWTETRMDYEEDSEGRPVIDRIDPLEMGYDCSAKKRNLADARHVWRSKEYSKDEFRDLWPEHEEIVGNSTSFWSDIESDPHDADRDAFYENDQSDKLSKSGKISVIQFQWYENENFYQIQDQTGQIIELNEKKFSKLSKYIEMMGLRYVRQKRRVYRQMFLSGETELETMDLQCGHFTFQCVTGLRDRNSNTWFSLVDLMRDPQKWANKWLSQILHIINTNAKGGLLAEQGAFTSPREAEQDWAKPDSIVWLNDGGLQRIQQKEPPRYPEGLDRLLNYAVSAINDVVGVSIEMLGMTNRDQPGYLEEMRKTSSISLLATFFSSLRYYRKRQGRVLAEYIKNYVADGRLVRIAGQDGSRYIPLLRDDMSYKYDVVVDDAPSSANMKERTFNTLIKIIPIALQAGIPIPPEVLDYTPLPESLNQAWKKLVKPSPEKQQKMKEMEQIKRMLAQLEVQDKQIDIQNKQMAGMKSVSEIKKNYAQAEQFEAVAQDEAAQAQQKLGILHAQQDMKYNQMMMDQARKDVELLLNNRRKALELELKAQSKAPAVEESFDGGFF